MVCQGRRHHDRRWRSIVLHVYLPSLCLPPAANAECPMLVARTSMMPCVLRLLIRSRLLAQIRHTQPISQANVIHLSTLSLLTLRVSAY